MKETVIKDDVEKILKEGFIYMIPLMEWVSTLVLVDKMQGTIHVCTNFRDLNKACPKDNFLISFIDKIIDECVRNTIFFFMDGFSSYNEI